MPRLPKLFLNIGSTNLAPSYPVDFKIHATTHHWRGERIAGQTWASIDLSYSDVCKTNDAVRFLHESFLDFQLNNEPSKDNTWVFPENSESPIALTFQDKEYFEVVKEATDLGWAWEESSQIDLSTGEREKRNHCIFEMSLYSWEWSGRKTGGRIQFAHLRREGESKAGLLKRILETAEKAKHDFPSAIPYQTLRGTVEADDFKTEVVFGTKYRF